MARYNVTFEQLDSLLYGLSNNTKDTPYDICITQITKEQCSNRELAGIISKYNKKYLSLSFTELPQDFYDASNMFYDCSNLTSINTYTFGNIIITGSMFYGCSSLTSIDTSAFRNVTDASHMFTGCSSLTSIDTSVFGNVTNAGGMFGGCDSLTSIDTSAFGNVTNASGMFSYCTSLTSIDTSVFGNVTNASHMFYNCGSLTKVRYWGFGVLKLEEKREMFDPTVTDIYCKNVIMPNPYDGSELDCNLDAEYNEVEQFVKNDLGMPNVVIHKGVLVHTTPIYTPFVYLNTLLTQMPENNKTSPYDIEITQITNKQCTNYSFEDTEGNIKYVLHRNNNKYLILGFTSLPDNASAYYMFYNCKSLVGIRTRAFSGVKDFQNAFTGTSLENFDFADLQSARSIGYMFKDCKNLKTVNINYNLNISSAYGLFLNCNSLTNVNLKGLSKIESGLSMFEYCTSLTSVDTSYFSNITSGARMFYMCSALTSINTSNFSQITDATQMFNYSGITSIDCSAFSNVVKASAMFSGCRKLTVINNWNFDKNKLESYGQMLVECPATIYVKPKAKQKVNTLVKITKSSNSIKIKSFPLTSDTSEEISVGTSNNISIQGVVDELLIKSSITDDLADKIRRTRYKWSSANNVLDPDSKNFVIWADEDSNVVQNIFNDDSDKKMDIDGSNASSGKEVSYNLLKDTNEATSSLDENTQFLFKYVTPSKTNGSYYFRKASIIWSWIKDKISSVLGLTETSYSGKASTAGTADNATNATNLKVSNHDTNNTTYYPVWANGKGDGSTPRGTYTSTSLNYVPATGDFKSKQFTVDGKVTAKWNSTTSSLDFTFI